MGLRISSVVSGVSGPSTTPTSRRHLRIEPDLGHDRFDDDAAALFRDGHGRVGCQRTGIPMALTGADSSAATVDA